MAPLLKHNSELLFVTSDKTGGCFPPNLTTAEGNPTAGHDLVAMNGTQRLQPSTESTSGLANAPLCSGSPQAFWEPQPLKLTVTVFGAYGQETINPHPS